MAVGCFVVAVALVRSPALVLIGGAIVLLAGKRLGG